MAIVIYTYHDPYKMNKEPYWNEIRNCPYFCVSQTLVNGLHFLYKEDFIQGRVSTTQNLIDGMFQDWNKTSCIIRQHAVIDNIISSKSLSANENDIYKKLANTFMFNRDDVCESLRILFELNININDIIIDKLTPEQTVIIDLYKTIMESDRKKDFELKRNLDEDTINKTLSDIMFKSGKNLDLNNIQLDRVVIHGVHQFSPILLCAIEELAKYKKVILLFNYQPQYKNIYQTWIDIYTAFDCPITDFKGDEFRPSLNYPLSYKGNILADNLGKLVEGQTKSITSNQNYEIIEFDNMAEFASYVADIFDAASKTDPTNPMRMMREQIYSADSSVNNILKIYFPEQFGERQFLNYPLGHFFLAIANMWDPVNNRILVSDFNDIKECLQAGILKEDYLGQLSSIFGELSALFEGCTSIDEMISHLKQLKRNKKYLNDPDKLELLNHISYYNVEIGEINKIEQALSDLQKITAYFFEDFEKHEHNFREFYKRLKGYLQQNVLDDAQNLGEEFKDIIRRVLDRLEEVENIDASASFECLKSTMSIYLMQETKPGKSANWIARGFEQIEGDVLRTQDEQIGGNPMIVHFACLSDEDIDCVESASFSWPLTDAFFDVALDPVDWKYQVYVKSRKEYKNFKRYALLSGLEFNRAQFKLSYVKRNENKESEPYYLLKVLKVKKVPYEDKYTGDIIKPVSNIFINGSIQKNYDQYDYYRYRICKYKFLMETLIEGNTVYKDPFLLTKYFEVMLENQLREALQGYAKGETILTARMNDEYDELKKYFPFISDVDRIDIFNNVRHRLLNVKSNKFSILSNEDRRIMMIRELFIYKQLYESKISQKNIMGDKFTKIDDEKIAKELSEENLNRTIFGKEVNLWCQYCANREYCAAYYIKPKKRRL